MLARLTETPASLAAAGLVMVAVAGAAIAFLAARTGSVVVAYLGSGLLGLGVIVLVRAVWRALQAAERQRSLLARALEASSDPQVIVGPDAAAVLYNPLFRDLAEPAGGAPLAALELACEGTTGRLELRRLDAAARAGAAGSAEFAMSGPEGPVAVRVEARPLSGWPGHVHWRIATLPPAPAAPAAVAQTTPDLDEAPIGALVVAEDGRITYANAAVADWLGGSVAELTGGALHLHQLLEAPPAGAASFAVAPGAGQETLTVALALPGGQRQPFLVRQRFRREDGRIRGTELFVQPAPPAAPATAPAPEPPALPASPPQAAGADEIAALQQALRRMESFFNEAPFGVALFDDTLHLLQCNATFRRMAGGDDPVGRAFADLVESNRAGPFAERLAELVAGGEAPLPAELRFAGEGGVTAQLYASRVALDGPQENLAGVVLHAVDMTDQKNLEAQFVQSQKMQAIGQLAGGVAHDFNNLLTAMIGFCDLLLLRHKPGDQSFSDIMQIKQNANRAANLVRQLLAFSRQQTLQPRVLDVTDVLAELSHLLRRLIGENIEFKMLHGRDLGLVKVDQGQLEQVIINMVVNGRDAMPDGGRLTISTRNFETPAAVRWGSEEMPPGRYVVVEVSDTGIGIEKDNLERIFEPFFSTKEVGAGTGLGLSTVYGIVRQTGGFVFVDSAPGEGARFAVYLPRHEEAAAPEPAATAEARDRAPSDLTGAGTILLVEDEDAVRVFSARALRNKGYQVLEARTGEAALAMLRDGAREVDLVITDVVMPEMDGPTLVRNLRPLRPNLKVIFISGYTEDRFRGTLEEDVPIEFLPKPFSLKQLASKVKEVLGKE